MDKETHSPHNLCSTQSKDNRKDLTHAKVSLFSGGIKSVIPERSILLDELVKLQKSSKQKELTARIIAAETDDEKQQLKLQSYFITPYGVFNYRNNAGIVKHNSRIVALDFDKMTSKQVAKLVAILIANKCCVLCFKSARQKGVKALILISEAIPLESHYLTLKTNAAALLEAIGATEYSEYLDLSQFVLCQPFFLSYDPDLFSNPDAEPLQIKLIAPDVRTPERFPVREWDNSISESQKARIMAYVDAAVSKLCSGFENETGERHQNIAKVKAIAGLIIGYDLPNEAEVYETLENSIIAMYGGESGAKTGNAYKSLKQAWEAAEPLRNETIESILNNDLREDFKDFDDFDEAQEAAPEKANIKNKAYRDTFRVSATEELKPPEIALSLYGSILGTLGNFSLIIGKAKAKKSFLICMVVAVALIDDLLHGIFQSSLPPGQDQVLYFDTEMSKYHVQLAVRRICSQIGISEPKNLHVFHLRSLPPAERLKFIEAEIYSNDNIGFVVIDGIKDLITSINDEDQASMIASKLLKWTEERNIHVVTVLHQNKGDTNARGHVGTELINKAETVLSVTVLEHDKEVSIVEPQQCRNREPESFAFKIDENGLPYIISEFETEKPKKESPNNIYALEYEKLYELISDAFSNDFEIKYAELVRRVKISYNKVIGLSIGDNKARDVISLCKGNGFVDQRAEREPYRLLPFSHDDLN
jgi:hypothetical protein